MRKIALATLLAVILSNCEVKMQQTNAQLTSFVTDANNHTDLYYSRKTIDGMEYIVFLTGAAYGGSEVINLTKEKLEVEKLRL